MDDLREAAVWVMGDLGVFSEVVLKRPLYGYQLAAARAILESVQEEKGLEFLLVMPRQSGKNELVAQLLCFLLNLQRLDGGNIVYGAIGDGVGRGIRRLEEHLDNAWNKRAWKAGGRPARRMLGKAAVVFLSSHRQAYARGETAHHLLVIDELQDQDAAHLQAVFEPMRAAGNATAVYLGTARTTYDALWQKKEALERLQAQDGIRRVFMVGPEEVTAENHKYERFLAAQIAKHGRKHPLIASEYFLEPLDRDGGLFPERRLRLMRGGHGQQSMINEQGGRVAELQSGKVAASESGKVAALQSGKVAASQSDVFVATLDVAGIDEAPTGLTGTDAVAALDNPARDYTTCTVFRVAEGQGGKVAKLHSGMEQPIASSQLSIVNGPVYEAVDVFVDQGSGEQSIVNSQLSIVNGPVFEAVDVFVDQGSQHFREGADGARGSGPSLARQLLAYLEHWGVAHVVGDATGVGEGLLNWLGAALGKDVVHPFKFTRRSKAQLGVDFVALVETNRFKYFEIEHEFDDAWWFFEQARQCVYELGAGRPMERDLRWFVPGTARVSGPHGRVAVHDDRLISAALVAETDRLIREGRIMVGRAESAVIRGVDPIEELSGW